MTLCFFGFPISIKYCFASFIEASTASDPLETRYTLSSPVGEFPTNKFASFSAGSLVKNDVWA